MEALPPPDTSGDVSLEQALVRRRSVRSFSDSTLSRKQTGQILFAAQGVTQPGTGYRTAPSAGATYPLETYAFTPEGVYKYAPAEHAIELVKNRDLRKELSAAALGQRFVRNAPLVVVFTAVNKRTTQRYGGRGVRYVHMEAGHVAQNIHLQAVALGLGSVPVGAFDDDEVREVLDCKGEEPLYIVPVGFPAQ